MARSPMLAVAWDQPFDDPSWLFEPKWDGVRCLAAWNGDTLSLRSRSGREMAGEHPGLPAPLDRRVVLDAEIVALDEDGRPSFQLLQSRLNLGGVGRTAEASAAPVVLFVFDVLEVDGEDLTARSLRERRAVLDGLHLRPPWFRSDGVVGDGLAFWEAIGEQGLEGMVAKELGSPYRAGVRSPEWRKIVRYHTVRAVVGGFTEGEGARAATFGSLQLGLHDEKGLRWIGSVGTGFDDVALRAIREALDEMTVQASPFADETLPVGTSFVEPRLVAHVRFKEWTRDGRLRHPSFQGFGAEDPVDVTWEAEGPLAGPAS